MFSSHLLITLLLFTLKFNVSELFIGSRIKLPEQLNFKPLPSFWQNTGFCPPAPIDNVTTFFLSKDVELNLGLIGANQGINSIRIHWLLELLTLKKKQLRNKPPVYNFTNLDRFLLIIQTNDLLPSFEIMGNPSNIFHPSDIKKAALWQDLVSQIFNRYQRIFGAGNVAKWNFETWNEPDLKNYDTLNWTLADYEIYVQAVKNGLNAAEQQYNIKTSLRGPAGLFKSRETHIFCWHLIEMCARNITSCPFDEITFHRKGTHGVSAEITAGTRTLIQELTSDYPALKALWFSNNEADPISGWSKPREFQSDVRYAAILIETVFQHWHLIYSNETPNLKSISHDNAFLSYHPHEFDQRTLLARFQMNLTRPPHVQFVQKPVYAALEMLANLGELASGTFEIPDQNLTYLITRNSEDAPLYVCIIAVYNTVRTNETFRQSLDISHLNMSNNKSKYFVESLQTNVTDPVSVWRAAGSPAYPNGKLRRKMRLAQVPSVLQWPVNANVSTISVEFNQTGATVLSIRICDETNAPPVKIRRLRIMSVNMNEILLLWKPERSQSKCIKTFEIFHQAFKARSTKKWTNIARHQHIPFSSFQYQPKKVGLIFGKYKVRAVDIFNRKGQFSNILKYSPT